MNFLYSKSVNYAHVARQCIKRGFTSDPTPAEKWYGNPTQHPFYDPWFRNSTRGPEPRTRAGGRHTISMIPGVGVGREMMEKVAEVFECCGAPVDYDWIDATTNENDFENMVLSVQRHGVGVKGNIEDKHTADELGLEKSRNSVFRQKLDLFVNVTECKSYPELRDRMKLVNHVDLVVVRSNTEGEYALLEHKPLDDVVENLRLTTEYNTRRVAHYAFQYATAHKRHKVTILHNYSLTPVSDGLLVKTVEDVAFEYPNIKTEINDFHSALRRFMIDPTSLDVIISNSMFCSQFIHILMGIIGSTSLLCGGNLSSRFAVFEPATRDRGMETAEEGTSNPTSFLLAGAAALDVCGASQHAAFVREAIQENFRNGIRTNDIGGTASTAEFVNGIIKTLKRMTPRILCKADPPPIHRMSSNDSLKPGKYEIGNQQKRPSKSPENTPDPKKK